MPHPRETQGRVETPAGWECAEGKGVIEYLSRRGRDDLVRRLHELGIGGSASPRLQSRAEQQGLLGPTSPWGQRPQQSLPLEGRTLVMGVLNVTPDSFSDGGLYYRTEEAIQRGLEMARAGADIIDVGGESTRPGAQPVTAAEEIRRVVPVIQGLAPQVTVPLSVDTAKAEVAAAALAAGAHFVNDVTALTGDERMSSVVVEHGAGLMLMHMRGTPRDMQNDPRYESVVAEILVYLAEQAERAVNAGVDPRRLWVDPGIGFGKTMEHNLDILRSLRAFRALGYPVLVGPSRKSFLGRLLHLDLHRRVEGTAATVALAVAQGIEMVRVHDVEQMVPVVRVSDALVRGWRPHRVYLSLGSNEGDPAQQLEQGVRAIAGWPNTHVIRCSSLYETDPVGDTDQPPFLNLALEITTELDLRRLLRELHATEAAAGRVRTDRRWGPRPLDVDILLVDEMVSHEPWLTLPHPRMDERGFVLIPLAEIAPGLTWAGRTVEDRIDRLQRNGHLDTHRVRRVLPPLVRVESGA